MSHVQVNQSSLTSMKTGRGKSAERGAFIYLRKLLVVFHPEKNSRIRESLPENASPYDFFKLYNYN